MVVEHSGHKQLIHPSNRWKQRSPLTLLHTGRLAPTRMSKGLLTRSCGLTNRLIQTLNGYAHFCLIFHRKFARKFDVFTRLMFVQTVFVEPIDHVTGPNFDIGMVELIKKQNGPNLKVHFTLEKI